MHKKEIPEGLADRKSAGPYSPAIKRGSHFHFSGIIPLLGEDKKPTSPDIAEQTRQIMEKIADLFHGCGLSLNDLLKVTILIKANSDEEFAERYLIVNEVYAEALKDVEIMPTRKAFGASALPFGVLVEIEPEACQQE